MQFYGSVSECPTLASDEDESQYLVSLSAISHLRRRQFESQKQNILNYLSKSTESEESDPKGRAQQLGESVRRHSHDHGQLQSHIGHHGHVHVDIEGWNPDAEDCSCTVDGEEGEDSEKVRVGRRRQVVGIVVRRSSLDILGLLSHSCAFVMGSDAPIRDHDPFSSYWPDVIDNVWRRF